MSDIFSESAKALKEISYSLNFAFISVAYFVQTGGVNWYFRSSGPEIDHYTFILFLFILLIKSLVSSFICFMLFMIITQLIDPESHSIYFLALANFFIAISLSYFFFRTKLGLYFHVNTFWFIFSGVFGFSLQKHKEIFNPKPTFKP